MKRHIQVIFEGLLSILIIIDVLVLGLLTVEFTLGVMPDTIYSFSWFDLTIAILILLDFIFFRIRKEKFNGNNWQFLRENWAYIVSIIPLTFICFNIFQLFGYITIIGLIGILRIYALYIVLRITGRSILKYPSKTKLDYATVILLLVLVIGSFLFFITEKTVNPKVPNYESAMWFSIVSMTTTGYGDIVPYSATGRIIAIIFILTGMSYLSLLTATLAYSFIDLFRKESRKAAEKLQKRSEEYNEKLDEVLVKLDKIEKKVDEKEKR